MRGLFDNFAKTPAYNDAEKNWVVELARCDMFWYDLIINPVGEFDVKGAVAKTLKKLEKEVKESSGKRFIYFLVSRPKIRIAKKPQFSLFRGDLIIPVRIGKNSSIQKIRAPILDTQTGRRIKPEVAATDRIITFEIDGHRISYSIHDFLLTSVANLGLPTEIHYVGYTKNPSSRPLNREHRGLADVFYTVSNDENDFFVMYCLFNVFSVAENRSVGLNFCLPNAAIDEIKADEEGRIIEKALIRYFSCKAQMVNAHSEAGELENQLKTLMVGHNIQSIKFMIEVDSRSDYYCFSSENVAPSHRHEFRCALEGDKVIISPSVTWQRRPQ